MTEADWEAIRAQPCAMCGLAYHRYCDHDPEHKWSATACINSLRAEVERLRGVVARELAMHEPKPDGVRERPICRSCLELTRSADNRWACSAGMRLSAALAALEEGE